MNPLAHREGISFGEKDSFGDKEKKRGLTASLFRDPFGARTQDPNIKSVVLYRLS